MQLTITTDYAIRIICFLAERQQMTSTAELASLLEVPVNYIPKITKQLKKANLISAMEGSRGGYVLAKHPDEISLMDVISSTENTMAINRCLEKDRYCSGKRIDFCKVHKVLLGLQNNFNSKLEQIKISDLTNTKTEEKKLSVNLYSVLKVDLDVLNIECLYFHSREIENLAKDDLNYNDFVERYVENYVHPDDIKKIRCFLEIRNLEEYSETCQYEEMIQYRRKMGNDYIWMEMQRHKASDKNVVILTFQNCKLVSRTLVSMEQELRKNEQNVNRQYWDMIALLVDVLNHNNLTNPENQEHICFYTEQVYRKLAELYPELGITEYEIENVSHLAPIHDIGKIRVPIEILNKKGKLSPAEMEKVKIHPVTGAEMTLHFPKSVSTEQLNQYSYDICHSHHERYDGNGYPDGLKGEEIPLCAQIVGLVDAYDALISKRPYKDKYEHEEAIRMIINGECGAFSKTLIRCFMAAAMQPEWIKIAES